jgi:hypothetical protein
MTLPISFGSRAASGDNVRGRSPATLPLQGSISRGIMRWQLTVVRPCDMFWMGVTSRFSLDMSSMIAKDRHVWMVSEEGTCFEHCRGARREQSLCPAVLFVHRHFATFIIFRL